MFLFLSRHFGTGVLLATAFVHLFPTAYTSLTDPCLAPFWNKGYPAMPGLIAMVSVFVVVGIEQFFAMGGAKHTHGSMFESMGLDGDVEAHVEHNGNPRPEGLPARKKASRKPAELMFQAVSSEENLISGRSPSFNGPSRGSDAAQTYNNPSARTSLDSSNGLELGELGSHANSGLLNGVTKRGSSSEPQSPTLETNQEQQGPDKKALLQCLLLEAGILFHSIFIGMALSVTPAPAFWILLIAISFHQTFEGLALGSRISALAFPARSPQPWLMALAYGTTTPFGQAIGLAIHKLYDPASETGLLSVGIMNAISSGLLLFAGLVELLAEDFLSDESYKTLRGKRRLQACGSVMAGAALMALVGAWA